MGDSTLANNEFLRRNWHKATTGQIRKMCPQERARYLAYEEPPKAVQNVMYASRQRVCSRLAALKSKEFPVKNSHETDKKKEDSITWQLKAAEALNRLRFSKFCQQHVKAKYINLLVCYQPTAWRAIRLEHLIPLRGAPTGFSDVFNRAQRHRVEELLDDGMWDTLLRH